MEPSPGQMAAIGQWMSVRIWGIERLAHAEFAFDGQRHAYVVTVYKGNQETGEGLSAEYWRATSDRSLPHAFELISELVSAEGPPPGYIEAPAPL